MSEGTITLPRVRTGSISLPRVIATSGDLVNTSDQMCATFPEVRRKHLFAASIWTHNLASRRQSYGLSNKMALIAQGRRCAPIFCLTGWTQTATAGPLSKHCTDPAAAAGSGCAPRMRQVGNLV